VRRRLATSPPQAVLLFQLVTVSMKKPDAVDGIVHGMVPAGDAPLLLKLNL
jgi:hypothetical protein